MKKSILLLLIICGLFISCRSIPEGYNKIAEGSQIYTKYDEFQDVTWTWHEELFESRPCKIYYGEQKNQKFPRIYFYYNGDNWIFFENATFINDQKDRFYIEFNYWNKKENINDGSVSESIDSLISDKQLRELQTVLNGTNVHLRLSGKKYKEYNIENVYLEGLKEIINSYFEN